MDAPTPQAKDTFPKTTSNQKKMIVTDGDYKFIMIKNSEKPAYGQTVIVNGLKAFYAPKDAGLLKDAINYNIRYARLLELNDLPDEPLEADMFIYLEKKNSKGSGLYHVVKPGETMLQIAQYEGIVLRNLRQINKLKDNEEPVSGTLLHLQDLIDLKPDVIVKKKENKQEAFVGYEATPVPQGQSRMRSGYISKKEIEASSNKERTTTQKQEPITPKEEVVEVATTVTTIPTPPPTPIEAPKDIVVKETPRSITPKVEAMATAKEETKTIVDTVAKALPPATDDEILVKKAPDVVEEIKTVETTRTTSIAAPTLAVKEPVVEKSVAETNSKEATLKKETTAPITEATSEIAVAAPILADTTTPPPVEELVKEEEQAPPPIEEPKDEYDRLKQRLDKAVYASNKTAKTKTATTTTSTPIPPTPPATTMATNEPVYYTVQKGDNAFGIAKKHNITMGQLKEWNKLDFSEIKVGQKLRVK
jgi:LysM repeat protein